MDIPGTKHDKSTWSCIAGLSFWLSELRRCGVSYEKQKQRSSLCSKKCLKSIYSEKIFWFYPTGVEPMTFHVSVGCSSHWALVDSIQLVHVTPACDTARLDGVKCNKWKHLKGDGFDSRWEDSELFSFFELIDLRTLFLLIHFSQSSLHLYYQVHFNFPSVLL